MLGADNAVAEFGAGDVGETLVAKTVAGQLVAGRANVAHQRGKALGHPAEHEKRGADIMTPEKLQHTPGIGFDTHRPTGPILAPNAFFESGNLEIVLDVYRHGVDDRPGWR